MALYDYAARRTGLLLVDTYNDLLSEGGKLWPKAKAVAEAVGLLPHLRALVDAARRAGVVLFHVPHRKWREGGYDGWRHRGNTGHSTAEPVSNAPLLACAGVSRVSFTTLNLKLSRSRFRRTGRASHTYRA